MQATHTTIDQIRKEWKPNCLSTVTMTAVEFAQIKHNLDHFESDTAYTPRGEKWCWDGRTQLWIRVCWEGYRKHFKANGRRNRSQKMYVAEIV